MAPTVAHDAYSAQTPPFGTHNAPGKVDQALRALRALRPGVREEGVHRRASVKQATGRGGPEYLVVLNPAHVIHVSEEAN